MRTRTIQKIFGADPAILNDIEWAKIVSYLLQHGHIELFEKLNAWRSQPESPFPSLTAEETRIYNEAMTQSIPPLEQPDIQKTEDYIADILRSALADCYPDDVPWTGAFGFKEFMTEEEINEREEKVYEILTSIDFTNVIRKFVQEKIPTLDPQDISWYARSEILSAAADYMKEYDAELTAKMRRSFVGRQKFPEEYGRALPPIEVSLPEDGTPEWNMAFEMKANLARDPVTEELEEEFGRQGNPYYSVIDKTVKGFVYIKTYTTIEGESYSSRCGGYYAGTDSQGYPLFVTAKHCIEGVEGPTTILTATGEGIIGEMIAEEKDSVVLRGNRRVGGLQPLRLGENRTPWGLAVSPRYKEAELIRYNPEWGLPLSKPYQDPYSFVNRGRGGWSGSPVLNSLGEVTGIVSQGQNRMGAEVVWQLTYVPISVLRQLYQNAGFDYLESWRYE